MSRDLERAALSHATNGFRVFPITPGTNAPPLHTGWQHRATSDPAQVAEFWKRSPDANVGVLTGGATRLVVIDADTEDAIDHARALGVPERTPTARTPRGGRHFYLIGNVGSYNGVARGLDVKGHGGYAAGVGSVRDDGEYRWLIPPWEIELARLPEPLARLINQRQVARRQNPTLSEIVTPGRRNDTLTSFGGSMRRVGFAPTAIRSALLAENKAAFRPPLSESEVEKVARSVSRMDAGPDWLTDPLRYAEDSRLSAAARHVLVTLALRARDDGAVFGGEWVSQVTGVSRNTITKASKELERHGRVRIQRRPRKANVYTLLPMKVSAEATIPARRAA
jgi:hypothetical protein